MNHFFKKLSSGFGHLARFSVAVHEALRCLSSVERNLAVSKDVALVSFERESLHGNAKNALAVQNRGRNRSAAAVLRKG